MSRAQPGGQPSHRVELQRFRTWIEHQTEASYDITTGEKDARAGFIPVGCIEKYFNKPRYEDITRILEVVFELEGTQSLQIRPRDVARHCPRVFCILVLIGQAKYIHTFVSFDNLADRHLPFRERPPEFPPDEDGHKLWERFYEEQWRFCSPQVGSHGNLHFDSNHILPITQLEKKGVGNYGVVYRAAIHNDHDELADEGTQASPSVVPQYYAIKRFKRRNIQSHDQEARAFTQVTAAGIRSTPGLIKFYSSFGYKDSFNIVLEYADQGTLEEYFGTHTPPANAQEMLNFWEQLLETVKAVNTLHLHYHRRSSQGHGLVSRGWHQDLKPDNILVLTNRDASGAEYLFKVADLGLAHFRTSTEAGLQEDVDDDTFGTVAYGAPECYRRSTHAMRSQNLVDNSVDIWSLGCIFSEAVVWSVFGIDGVNLYRVRRQKATQALTGFEGGATFHDGYRKLEAVAATHREIKRQLQRRVDYVLSPVLDRLVVDMLSEKPERRPSAQEVQDRAESLLEDARMALAEEKRMSGATDATAQSQEAASVGMYSTPHSRDQSFSPVSSHGNTEPNSPLKRSGQRDDDVTPARTSFIDSLDSKLSSLQTRDEPDLIACPYGCGYGVKESEMQAHAEICQGSAGLGALKPSSEHSLHRDARLPKKTSRPDIPVCTWAQAKLWHENVKNKNVKAVLPHAELRRYLTNRDHVFIIDDSQSMEAHWTRVVGLVLVLAYILKHEDPDKLELYFLSSEKVLKFKTSRELAATVQNHKRRGTTSLEDTLCSQLRQYGKKIDHRQGALGLLRGSLGPRSLYVFTDGILGSGNHKQGQAGIAALVRKLLAADMPKSQIGIQLISFGQDPNGLQLLRSLDHLDATNRLGLDIVDTEPANGNVWKMLLGAINDLFDNDEDQEIVGSAGPSSPVSPAR